MPSELKVNKLSPYTGTTLTLGDSGDTVSTDAVVQASQFIGGGLNAYRNIVINGDMQIAQRGTSVSGITNSNYRTVDRFTTTVLTAGTWTQSQDSDVPTGQGFANSLKMDCTTANGSLGAGSLLTISQRFEGQNLQYLKKGTANAESLTLSFWVKSNKTGTYICELYDNDNTRQFSKSYTIDVANTWEKKTLTFAGDTTGAFDNDNNLSLFCFFYLAAGTDYTSGTLNTSWDSATTANRAVGQVNLADNTANEWYITGVQLEAGTSASDFEFLPYDVNLQRCQRYYQKSYAYETAVGTNTGGGLVIHRGATQGGGFSSINISLRPEMRTTPTISYWQLDGTSGTWQYDRSGVGTTSFTPITGYVNNKVFTPESSFGANYVPIQFYGHWQAVAEL